MLQFSGGNSATPTMDPTSHGGAADKGKGKNCLNEKGKGMGDLPKGKSFEKGKSLEKGKSKGEKSDGKGMSIEKGKHKGMETNDMSMGQHKGIEKGNSVENGAGKTMSEKGQDKGIEKGKSKKGAGKTMSESEGQDKGSEKGKSDKGAGKTMSESKGQDKGMEKGKPEKGAGKSMSDQSKGQDKGIEKGKSEKGAGKSMSESGGQDKGMEKGKSEKGNTLEAFCRMANLLVSQGRLHGSTLARRQDQKARVFRRAIPGHSLKEKVVVTMTSRMARATMLTKARVPMGLSTRATRRARRATRPRRAQRVPRPMAFGYGLNMSHMSTPFQFPLKKVKNLSWMMMFMSRITHSLVFGPPTNQVALVIQVVLMVLVHRFPWWRCLMMIMSLQRNGHVSLTSQAMTLLFLTGAEPKQGCLNLSCDRIYTSIG